MSSFAGLRGSLVALNFHKAHLVEHIKDLYWALLDHGHFNPLPVIPVSSPIGRRSREGFQEWFRERFGLEIGETLIPYPWLSPIKPLVIIEPSVSPLRGLFKDVPKILSYHNLATMGFGKSPSLVRRIGDYRYLFLTGPLQKEAVVKAHRRYGGRLPEMVEVGYLRGDRLLVRRGTFDREGFLSSLGLEGGPTVMYAPTWGDFSSAGEWTDTLVDVCKTLDFNLLIRLHPLMLEGRSPFETGGVDWKARLKGILAGFPKARVLLDDDIDDAFLAAHVLVTDVSSVGMDFMLLEKPVVFLPAPRFFEVFGREFPISRVRGEREIRNKRELLFHLEDSVGKEVKIQPESMVYNPGRALKAMLDFLEETFL